jgi:hypothetical protein
MRSRNCCTSLSVVTAEARRKYGETYPVLTTSAWPRRPRRTSLQGSAVLCAATDLYQ